MGFIGKGVGNTTPVVDNSTSKYIDIGAVRIQWGRSSSTTITFPVPFKDTTYVFTPSFAGGDTGIRLYTVNQGARTTTTVAIYKRMEDSGGAIGSTSSENLDWIAIGIKP